MFLSTRKSNGQLSYVKFLATKVSLTVLMFSIQQKELRVKSQKGLSIKAFLYRKIVQTLIFYHPRTY